MAQYSFGTGTIAAVSTSVSNPTPVQFGVCQNISIDFKRSIKELVGQYQVPVALGAGELKISGKISWARISIQAYNSLFFGQTVATGMVQQTPAPGISGTVPATPYQLTPTVPNSGTWSEDTGVFYSATGTQFVRVASSPTIGQYSVSAGVYTFAAADTAATVLFFFNYTMATGNKVALSNQLMGSAPTFELTAQEQFAQFGTTKLMCIQLNSCMANDLTFPLKNTDFTIPDMGFMIQADAAGNFGTLSITDP